MGISNTLSPLSLLQFFGAYISEVQFPSVEASSKDPAYFTLTIRPNQVRYFSADTLPPELPPLPSVSTKGRAWWRSNFRFNMEGTAFTEACKRIAAIDAFVVKQQIDNPDIGVVRDPQLLPSKLSVSNLAITLPAQNAKPF